ncbi:2-dehydropantoate 2-reductase [Chitinophaga sancti]|uniref:2-dehydropantoate 2-reductase n=1 Tax=Chitinophaga sancti TaxID=1004 RepID=A0A1K1SX52_9BACT|nr:2-dehydropantoate 2-reductase [Chitinophaga sancti]WQD63112.1 2-dehydropantoate 2-reductase [Chitinophaga sancti]WQG91263.1 2-dehydropantoate 2-reductase [Chitinophaga sancti]SFW88639.1 2-dehydropantoate 2-reductase [Chitinophaga sancti]
MKYAIIGTGAIGGFYGAQLANAGEEVHFLLNSDYAIVKEEGLHVISEVYSDIHLEKLNAYQHAIDMPACDVILVCLKTTSNASLLPSLVQPLLHSGSVIILIQNGLGVEADVAAMFPGVGVAGATALVSVYKVGPGQMHHLDYGDIEIGNYNVQDTTIIDKVVAAFDNTGLISRKAEDLNTLRWKKLVWNITFNGMCVVLNTTANKLLADRATYNLSKEIMHEVILGANACGAALPESMVYDMLQFTIAMRPYAPSMKLDYDAKRPMELKYIYENPVAMAKAAGYYMSKVDMLLQQLLFLGKY